MKKNIKLSDLVGDTGKMGNASCYPTGICTKTHILGNYAMYDKTYTVEDSILLRALSVYSAKMLDGNYMTIIPNVKDKVPLYRDEFDMRYKSPANGGRGRDECGEFDNEGSVNIITNKCLHVFYMYMEASICYKKLIGSYQQSLLRPGAGNTEENTALNDRVLDSMVRVSQKTIDRLIFHGDYKSHNDELSHFDGLIKKIYQAIGQGENQTYKVCFTKDMVDGDCLVGHFGGHEFEIQFNTDKETTISDFLAFLSGLQHTITCQPILTASYDGDCTVTVVSNYDMMKMQMTIDIKKCEETVTGCCIKDEKGEGCVTIKETVYYRFVDKPIVCPNVPISAGNVIQELTKLYLKAAAENPDLMKEDDFYIHVSSHVFACLQVAQMQLTGAFMGINGMPNMNPNPYGLKIVEQPGLERSFMIGTRTSNIFFGTDLMSDMMNTDQWVDKDCQQVKFRHEIMAGVQIDRFSETVSNLDCMTLKFKPAQPEVCNILDQCGNGQHVANCNCS